MVLSGRSYFPRYNFGRPTMFTITLTVDLSTTAFLRVHLSTTTLPRNHCVNLSTTTFSPRFPFLPQVTSFPAPLPPPPPPPLPRERSSERQRLYRGFLDQLGDKISLFCHFLLLNSYSSPRLRVQVAWPKSST